jgi:hypothetical protein
VERVPSVRILELRASTAVALDADQRLHKGRQSLHCSPSKAIDLLISRRRIKLDKEEGAKDSRRTFRSAERLNSCVIITIQGQNEGIQIVSSTFLLLLMCLLSCSTIMDVSLL